MDQNRNTPHPNTNTSTPIGFAGYEGYMNLLNSQNSTQLLYYGNFFNTASPPLQFSISPFMQQNANIQQNIFNTFGPMRQKITQPPPTQETVIETEAGVSQKAPGKKREIKKERERGRGPGGANGSTSNMVDTGGRACVGGGLV